MLINEERPSIKLRQAKTLKVSTSIDNSPMATPHSELASPTKRQLKHKQNVMMMQITDEAMDRRQQIENMLLKDKEDRGSFSERLTKYLI